MSTTTVCVRRVFPGATRQVLGNAMRNGAKAAGVPHFHPHDLRHRYASLKIAEGVPVTDLAAHLGHAEVIDPGCLFARPDRWNSLRRQHAPGRKIGIFPM